MKSIDLKAFRKANNISQVELAEYLGIGQSFISQMEKGTRPIPQEYISRILANPHNWDTSMLTSKSKYIVADGLLEGVEQFHKSAEELFVSYLQDKIENQDRLIRELYKEIGMLQAKLDLARKGETVPGATGSSDADAV